MEHDPLCPNDFPLVGSICTFCQRIAKARADEREKIAAAIEAEAALLRDFDPIYTDGLQDAARIAREGGTE